MRTELYTEWLSLLSNASGMRHTSPPLPSAQKLVTFICLHCTSLFLFACVGVCVCQGVITPFGDLRDSSEVVILKCTLCYIRMCDSVHMHITLTFSLLHLDDLANS